MKLLISEFRLSNVWLSSLQLSIALLLVFSGFDAYAMGNNNQRPKPYLDRAVSLRILQKGLASCHPKQQCTDDYTYLAGLTSVTGYVVDSEAKDVILIGKVIPGKQPLYTEDFVIALQNTWHKFSEKIGSTYYYTAPGCSIDQTPTVLLGLQKIGRALQTSSTDSKTDDLLKKWNNVCHLPQTVRVLGIPFDSHMAKILVDADYRMKKLVDGTITLKNTQFQSLTAMTIALLKQHYQQFRQQVVSVSTLNRFWFHAGDMQFAFDDGIAVLKTAVVQLSTEAQFVKKTGKAVGLQQADPLAEQFAKQFSDMYGRIAEEDVLFNELEHIFRIVAVTKALQFQNVFEQADMDQSYLVNKYRAHKTRVSRTLPGHASIGGFDDSRMSETGYQALSVRLPSCGGVQVGVRLSDQDFFRVVTDHLRKIKFEVVRSRLNPDLLYWDF